MNYLQMLTQALTIAGELEVDDALLKAGQPVTLPNIITLEGHRYKVQLVPETPAA